MTRCILTVALAPIALLAGCSEPAQEGESADNFAARINGEQQAAAASAQPNAAATPAATATPQAGAAPGPYSPGTATDPKSAGCGAPKVAAFYGRVADEAVRREVMQALAPQTNVRFHRAGSNVVADAGSPRLNVMLDDAGVIRDARCG